MYPDTDYCTRLRHLFQIRKQTPEYKEIKKQQDPVVRELERALFGDDIEKQHKKYLLHPFIWHNTIQCYVLNNIPLPSSISPELIEKVEYFENLDFKHAWEWNPEVPKLGIGRFLGELVNHFDNFIEKKSTTKFYLFSGHDTTIAPILASLRVFDGKFPPIGSYLILELFSKDGKYYIRIRYKNKDLKIPDVHYEQTEDGVNVCLYEDFKKVASKNIVSEEEYEEACNFNSSNEESVF